MTKIETITEPTAPHDIHDMIIAMRDEYVDRSWRDSLYAMPKDEERRLLAEVHAGDDAAVERLVEDHLGLVAFFVERENANGNSADLMDRGREILEATIRDFRAVNGNRLADAACEALDAGLAVLEPAIEPVGSPVAVTTVREPRRVAASIPGYATDQTAEACQAAWDGLHRTIAEGGNAYME